jgi:hypothetical protein
MKTTHTVALSVIAAIAGSAALVTAGPLNPPAGPVASTYKTLGEVEPRTIINLTNTPGDTDASPSLFKITQPGSYYLAGNINGVVGKHGIEITASGVTIDLNGFELRGVDGTLAGIATTASGLRNISIRNGSVRGWGGSGVDLFAFSVVNCDVSRVRAAECGSGGQTGGVVLGSRSHVTDVVAYLNTGRGIAIGADSVINNCASTNNTGNGIDVGISSTVTACTANNNGNAGISASGASITNCTAAGNTGNGFNNGSGGSTTACVAASNGGNGINSGYGTVSNCTARLNTLNGIVADSHTSVLNNTCSSNGLSNGNGAGILVTGTDNRIEGNNCLFADRGIDVNGIGNVIVRNTCSGNSINWSIDVGNVLGPILDRTAPGGVVINGNSATGTIGTTDPSANLTY